MTSRDYPRLCGGTFFTLVLEALQPRMRAKEHYRGESDGLSDPEVLIGLIKVINPDYVAPRDPKKALKTKTNEYKACKTSSGEYLPFGDTATIRAFDTRVREDYAATRDAMLGFVERFIDTTPSVAKDELLARALIDLIDQDQSIDDNEELYIQEGGQKVKKAAIRSLKKVYLPAFLLGVWHYAVVHRPDNSVGQDTYDEWCPRTGGPRPYKGYMGEGVQHIDMIPLHTVSEEGKESEPEESSEAGFSDQAEFEDSHVPPQGTTQIYNNPLFVQQNGNGNQIIPNYGTIVIKK